MVKSFKKYLNEARLGAPKVTSLNLSLENTGFPYLDNNYEQSYFEVSQDMINAMIKGVKKQSDSQWADAMGETVEEARKEKESYLKILYEWQECKAYEVFCRTNIAYVGSQTDKTKGFDHYHYIDILKQYIRDFGGKQ